jgi:hypothetical protein
VSERQGGHTMTAACCAKVIIMKITKRRIILGCFGLIALCCCLFLAYVVFLVSTMEWSTVVRNNMHDPEFRKEIEKWLDLEFPASAKWEESEYRVWQDPILHCVFTLPKKDVDLMFSTKNVIWHENDRDKLPQWSDNWLKEKNLDHFKVMKYGHESIRHVTIVVDNPPNINEDQRVWVYINSWEH